MKSPPSRSNSVLSCLNSGCLLTATRNRRLKNFLFSGVIAHEANCTSWRMCAPLKTLPAGEGKFPGLFWQIANSLTEGRGKRPCILNLALDAKKIGSDLHQMGATAPEHPPRQKESKNAVGKHSRTGTYLISENDRNCQQLRRILPGSDRSGMDPLPPKFDCLLKTKPFIKRCPERR